MNDIDLLWDEFNEGLLGYIKTKINNTHDAEDILQQVFIKVFKNIDKLENRDAIKTWLYKITQNSIIDFYKKKKEIYVAPETLYDISEDSREVDNMNDNISRCIGDMLFTLPEKYKAVYDLYENQDMRHKEIADTLEISVSTSKVRLSRAKEMFKNKLLDCCDFDVDIYGNVIDYHPKNSCTDCNKRC